MTAKGKVLNPPPIPAASGYFGIRAFKENGKIIEAELISVVGWWFDPNDLYPDNPLPVLLGVGLDRECAVCQPDGRVNYGFGDIYGNVADWIEYMNEESAELDRMEAKNQEVRQGAR